jgi:tRNA(adenine34) deaminase
MSMTPADAQFMDEALRVAAATGELGNVPVGAVLVVDGAVIARSGNLREVLQDPTAHAEMLALREGSQQLGRWRLPEATLYVTLEPCTMCAGAIAQSRIGRLVFAALEPKTGGVVSQHELLDGTATETTHLTSHGSESLVLLRTFFDKLRRGVRVVEGA